jgi:hypothetical protein
MSHSCIRRFVLRLLRGHIRILLRASVAGMLRFHTVLQGRGTIGVRQFVLQLGRRIVRPLRW